MAQVFAGCDTPVSAGLPRAEACLSAYCDRLAKAPVLCSDPGLLRRPDEDAARRAAAEFLAAKLALDHAVDGGDPRIDRVARSYAWVWSVDAMHAELVGDGPPLVLTVEIDALGFTIRGATIAAETLPADANRPLDDHERWNYAALERAARALKQRFPSESAVEIRLTGEVSMAVATRAIDALAGQGCTLPAADVPNCLFWRPVVVDVRP